jgi:hypothetical protein
MTFDVDSLQTEPIKKDADYQGIRVRCLGYLDNRQGLQGKATQALGSLLD